MLTHAARAARAKGPGQGNKSIFELYRSYYCCAFYPCNLDKNIQEHFEPSEENFILQVVDIRALSVLLLLCVLSL